ncbi:MAG: DNA-binding protein [Desulfurococcaceae archaeon TW002]
MGSVTTKKLNVGNKPMETYVLIFNNYVNQGIRKIVLHGRGDNIPRAVDLYNLISKRLGNLVRLSKVNIGTIEYSDRRSSYIELELEILH